MKSLGSTTIGTREPGSTKMAEELRIEDLEEAQQKLGQTLQWVLPSRSPSMAAGTCFRNLQEAQNKLEELLQTEIMKCEAVEMKIQEQISGMDKKLDQTLAAIQLQLLKLEKKHVPSEELNLKIGSPSNYAHNSLPRIDFPRFDGTNPRAWILKCSSYFKLISNVLDAQKINLAVKHFDGKALMWYQNLNMVEIGITWEQFLEVICARFEDVRVTNIFMQCNKLKQNGSYDDYVERFVEIRAGMVLHDSKYYEDSFIASFLSGLSGELQAFIYMFQPTNLEQTIELGRKGIHTLDVISKSTSVDTSSVQLQFPTYKSMGVVSPQVSSRLSNTTTTNPTTKLLQAAEISTCIDKCQARVSYLMMTTEEEEGRLFAAQKDIEFGISEVEITMVQNMEVEVLDAQKAIELGSPEVDSNMVQTVKEVHKFWKLISAQRVADLKYLDTGWRDSGQIDNIFVLQGKNNKEDMPPDLVPIVEEYASIFEEHSKCWAGHKQHSTRVLQLLQKHPLFAKRSTCSFDTKRVEFLGNITTSTGVAIEPGKIAFMIAWPTPNYVKQFKGKFQVGNVVYLWLQLLGHNSDVPLLQMCSGIEVVPVVEFSLFDPVGDYKITPLWVIGLEIVAGQDERYIRRKFSIFDPWGQGSSSGGGIVMDCGRVKKKEEEEKLEKWSRMPIWGREWDQKGRKEDAFGPQIIMIWAGWSLAVGPFVV